MATKRRDRRPSTITVEHSTTPGERAIQHPRRVSPSQVSGFGDVQVSRPHRFRNGKLVAVGGIPLKGEAVVGDSEAYALDSAGELLSEHIDDGYGHVAGWEHHAIQMFMDGNDEAIDCF